MLTLFCPWSTGLDLRASDISWGESYKSFEFTTRQVEIMKFMNIRYECNDARDDYATIRKKMGADSSPGYHGFDMDSEHQNGVDREIQEANADPYMKLFEDMILNESRKTVRHQREMAEIEELLRLTGWISIKKELNLPLAHKNGLEFVSGNDYTPDQWAKILANKKNEFQQLRVQTMTNTSDTTSQIPCSSQLMNIVKSVDQVFLSQRHQSCVPSDKELLGKCDHFSWRK